MKTKKEKNLKKKLDSKLTTEVDDKVEDKVDVTLVDRGKNKGETTSKRQLNSKLKTMF